MGFSPIPARPAPAGKRAPEKERSDNEHLRNRNRADHQPAGTGCSPVETALERSGSAAQPRVEEAISRCEFLPAVGDQVHLALLAHPQAGERAWRIGAEGRAKSNRRVLASWPHLEFGGGTRLREAGSGREESPAFRT